MRSTPFFLGGKLYHIRYDLNAVWDMERLIAGGFYSILDRPITLEFISDLLWFGLKWDNPDLTVSETREIITREIKQKYSIWNRLSRYINKCEDGPVLLSILTLCKTELIADGWLTDPGEQESNAGVGAKPAGTEPNGLNLITMMVHQMFYSRYPGDPWLLTPNEVCLYITARNEEIEREVEQQNFNTANLCAVIYNSQRKSNTDPVLKWSDFMPKKGGDSSKAQSAEDQQNLIMQMNAMCGGTVE